MASQAQIAANRLNARESTGPKTPQGKAAAAQNALKHGLYAARDVIITESQEDFDSHRQAFLAELAPQGPTECVLADRIISLSWRLKRAEYIQNQAFDAIHEQENSPLKKHLNSLYPKHLRVSEDDLDPALTLGRLALKDFAGSRVLERLQLYERRIENSLFKTLLELKRLTLLRTLTPEHPQEPTLAQPPRSCTHISQNMQNEPNSKSAQITTTHYKPTTYPNIHPNPTQKNKPKQTQSQAYPNSQSCPKPTTSSSPAATTHLIPHAPAPPKHPKHKTKPPAAQRISVTSPGFAQLQG